eukprot:Blabericola_migrator_1__2980@NODE_1861_length_3644_cov_104_762371_g1190_i0_p1_GENE_NODE_1861_length_3644_cov_104_762371_g1190_i0NODE_1861_length_3644_cov_104_762371_g1190_i0_p1_ORF_typecomplete_len716_score98_70_NODE_1861_length_3644_cov_104_762371_g1190_i04012548
MLGAGRCVHIPQGKSRESNGGISATDALGIGALCLLSIGGRTDAALHETHPQSKPNRSNPRGESSREMVPQRAFSMSSDRGTRAVQPRKTDSDSNGVTASLDGWTLVTNRDKETFASPDCNVISSNRRPFLAKSREQYKASATSHTVADDAPNVTRRRHNVSTPLLNGVRQRVCTLLQLLKRHGQSSEPIKAEQDSADLLNVLSGFSQATASAVDADSLAALTEMRASLLCARAEIETNPHACLTHRNEVMLDEAILILSCAWHRARMANLRVPGFASLHYERLGGFESVKRLTRRTPVTLFLSGTYASLLEENDSKEVVDSFFTFLESSNEVVSASAAKLCLSILLYLKYDSVNLIGEEMQAPLDKLISQLYHRLITMNADRLSVGNLSEVENFCLTYFGANPHLAIDWRAPLILDVDVPQFGQRPVIKHSFEYGNAFKNGLSRASKTLEETEDVSQPEDFSETEDVSKASHTRQVESLKVLYSYLLSMDSTEPVFEKAEFRQILDEFSAFAESCLIECYVDGFSTQPWQTEILGVMMDGIHWCRLLCAYWHYPPPRALKETYETIANAWLLKSLWGRVETFSLTDFERGFISDRLLAALVSEGLGHDLLAYSKAFLDHDVPCGFVGAMFNRVVVPQMKSHVNRLADEEKLLLLLASICSLRLLDGTVTGRSESANQSLRDEISQAFKRVLSSAQLVALPVLSPRNGTFPTCVQ